MNINEIIERGEARVKARWVNPFAGIVHYEAEAIIAHIRELEARAERAEAKVARLHDVLVDFARQKKTTELETEYEALNAAFEDAYDMFIDRSRAALAAMEATDE